MPKRGHLWPIWWKDKSTLTKQLFCFSSWIIFDFKIEISGKNWAEKHPHIIFFMFGSKTNEFGQVWTEKIGIWRKSSNGQKVLEFFSKTFCLFDLLCLTNFWCRPFGKRPIKKKATVKGRPRPSIFHPNLPKISKVTSPFLGLAVYSWSIVKQRGGRCQITLLSIFFGDLSQSQKFSERD